MEARDAAWLDGYLDHQETDRLFAEGYITAA